jgi:hypothetical protein
MEVGMQVTGMLKGGVGKRASSGFESGFDIT